MSTRTSLLAVGLAALASAALAPSAARAVNVLTDPGFESNPLTTFGNVLGNYPGFQNQWGQESSTIVTGPDGGVTPSGGTKMLKVFDTGSYSQTGQVVNVSSFAAAIDAGNVQVAGSALFNANLPAAEGSVSITFHDSTATYAGQTGFLGGPNTVLDATPQTWQSVGVNTTVPFGTRWLLFQVAYRDATLVNSAGAVGQGYVDDAVLDLRVVPEPTTLAAAVAGAGLVTRRRRV